ncbi:helicase-primase subunit [Spheniscid alphaherpesvirus 1]|uniref:Helicase-primase subunit n=1 Tax=Spheniscid alphaherpesvirus 1 TaxID=2560777 RepID=A0A1R3TFB1_9ALPH|nr:helicase-primase subunit [Spheniscid alphaherpesvirus 1]
MSNGSTAMYWTDGHICSASLYTVWTKQGHKCDANDSRLVALFYLLCMETKEKKFVPHFAMVEVSSEQLSRGCRAEVGFITPARATIAAHEASHSGCWPLSTLGNVSLWQTIYGNLMACLRLSLGYNAFYEPVRLGLDTVSGLLVVTLPIKEDITTDTPAPRPGLLRADASIKLDSMTVKANAIGTDGSSMARARLMALRGHSRDQHSSLDIEITTKETRFSRRYNDSLGPPSKRGGCIDSILTIEERHLKIPDTNQIVVRVMVPKYYDCLVASADGFSAPAVMLLYMKWHEALYSMPGAVPSIFAYLGPELSPNGEDTDYFCMIGFPGWPTIKADINSGINAARDSVALYTFTDGLWPVMGIRAFQLLTPWGVEKPPIKIKQDKFSTLMELSEKWPAGKIVGPPDAPISLSGLWIAKYDFSVFFPALYLSLVPEHSRLAKAVAERIARRCKFLKQALVYMFGGLQHLDKDAYKAIIGLANIIGDRIEAVASDFRFATLTYIKDGFWGAFADDLYEAEINGTPDRDVMHHNPSDVPPISEQVSEDGLVAAADKAERLRLICQTVANETLREFGLNLPGGIQLTLRTEGLYTDAISWGCNNYWLWNRFTQDEEFVGFPCRSMAWIEAKSRLGDSLRTLALASCEAKQNVIDRAEWLCDELAYVAFQHRLDASFWCVQTPISEQMPPPSVFANGQLLDCDHKPRKTVLIKTPDNGTVSVPCSLFPANIVTPGIACVELLEPIYKTFCSMFNRALEAKWEDDDYDKLVYPIERVAFLFN